MTDFKSIIKDTEKFVSNYLKTELSSDLCFHNYSHTKEVVFSVQELCSRISAPDLKKEVVILAAWFHDCGYSSTYKGHEEESCHIAKDFLKIKEMPSHIIKEVTDCIMATTYPQSPKTLEDEIICDADFFHFARADYDRHEERLRKEWKLCLGRVYTDLEWHEQNCKLLLKHQYFTDYGKNVLQKFKDVNIQMMKCKT